MTSAWPPCWPSAEGEMKEAGDCMTAIIDSLADLYDMGHLLASTEPELLLTTIRAEIVRGRDAAARLARWQAHAERLAEALDAVMHDLDCAEGSGYRVAKGALASHRALVKEMVK